MSVADSDSVAPELADHGGDAGSEWYVAGDPAELDSWGDSAPNGALSSLDGSANGDAAAEEKSSAAECCVCEEPGFEDQLDAAGGGSSQIDG